MKAGITSDLQHYNLKYLSKNESELHSPGYVWLVISLLSLMIICQIYFLQFPELYATSIHTIFSCSRR